MGGGWWCHSSHFKWFMEKWLSLSFIVYLLHCYGFFTCILDCFGRLGVCDSRVCNTLGNSKHSPSGLVSQRNGCRESNVCCSVCSLIPTCEKWPGVHCSHMYEIPFVTCLLLPCWNKFTANIRVPATRPYHSAGVEVAYTPFEVPLGGFEVRTTTTSMIKVFSA